MRGWERQKESATDRERIKTPQERPGIEWEPTYGSVNGMLWPPPPLQWLSDNKIRSKWLSMSRYVGIRRRKVKQWGWKTKTSTVNSNEDRMQNLPLQQSHLKVNMKQPSQPILLSYVMHFIVFFWIFIKIKVGQGLILFMWNSWKLGFPQMEFMKIGCSSPEPTFKEEIWRLMFKFTLQSISIYPNGRVRSCIWQSLIQNDLQYIQGIRLISSCNTWVCNSCT